MLSPKGLEFSAQQAATSSKAVTRSPTLQTLKPPAKTLHHPNSEPFQSVDWAKRSRFSPQHAAEPARQLSELLQEGAEGKS